MQPVWKLIGTAIKEKGNDGNEFPMVLEIIDALEEALINRQKEDSEAQEKFGEIDAVRADFFDPKTIQTYQGKRERKKSQK